ncbi:Phage-like element PBSX protein XkdW [Bacillus paralicheniformis]|uniref:XkdW family protein n=1 Tax=Bacillus paralicheniformis TaxID=1648923 RepID=UPI001352CD88|nr:XkdW family protein [Bacillus paralicheniformis]TWM32608.1 Phage-like element PBSX protein XkdW [Bacillus paralicheniformis]
MVLYDAIMYKYPEAIPFKDFEIRAEEGEVFITEWNLSESPPSLEELKSWWTEFQKKEPISNVDPVKVIEKELRQERIVRKKIEQQLAEMKLEIQSIKRSENK